MYEVNGFPSMVTSTRRCCSSATTWTPLPDWAAKAIPVDTNIAVSKQSMIRLLKDLASCDYLLGLVVKGDFLPGLDCSNVHAECNGVAVTRLNWRVRRLA